MRSQSNLSSKSSIQLKLTLLQYVAIASAIIAIVFISIFIVSYFGSVKDSNAIGISPVQGDIIISEYAAKGHNGAPANEFIELYNLSDSTIDLSNMSLMLFEKDNKGKKKQKGTTLQLTGTLLTDSFYVIAVKNKANQPTSALQYDLQCPTDWELKSKRFIELLSGTTVIDRAGSLENYGDDYNYERVDVLVEGGNIISEWIIQNSNASSPGAVNLSDQPQSLAVSTSTYTNFGSNANSEPAVKIKSNGSIHPGITEVKIKRGKIHPNVPIGTTVIKRYVEITPASQPDNVELVFYYNESELNGLSELSLQLFSYYNGIWHPQGGVVNTYNNTITVTSVNHFSDWTAGESTGGLPIELLSFDAKYNGIYVDLSWTTATETNNDYFTIERSMDAKNFEIVDNIKGAGNSNSVLIYNYIDDESLSGIVYYRLKQTDYDGKFEYFPIVAVRIASVQSQNQIHINSFGPNPFTNTFFVEFITQSLETVEVNIYEIKGQNVYKDVYQPTEGKNRYTYSDNANLSRGYYILSLIQNNISSNRIKILKE